MTEKRHFDFDPATGKVSTFEFDEDGGKTLIHEVTDVTDIIEGNLTAQTDGSGGWSKSREWRKAAEIPIAVAEYWKIQYGVDVLNPDHKNAVIKLLNSSDWRKLRTAEFEI